MYMYHITCRACKFQQLLMYYNLVLFLLGFSIVGLRKQEAMQAYIHVAQFLEHVHITTYLILDCAGLYMYTYMTTCMCKH